MPKPRKTNADAPAEGAQAVPSHDEIERRAHEIWLEQGAEPGHELDHWLQAEQELAGKPRRRAARPERSVNP
jgi:hypothetical protein